MTEGFTMSDEAFYRHNLADLLGVKEGELQGGFMVEMLAPGKRRIITTSDSNIFTLFLKRAGDMASIVDELGKKLCDEELSGTDQWEAGSNLRFEAERFDRLVRLLSGVNVEA